MTLPWPATFLQIRFAPPFPWGKGWGDGNFLCLPSPWFKLLRIQGNSLLTDHGSRFRDHASRIAFLASLVLAATGCSHLTSDIGRPLPDKPASLTVGESHLRDVLQTVGPPSKISAAAGGYAMLYEYNGIDERQLGLNLSLPVLRWFKFVGAKSWLDHRTWMLTFDTNDVLRGWGEERWTKVLGTGGGAQILVTVSSLVDSSQLRRPAPQHEWGKGCLVPLPKALNYAQNLDNGSFGFEQILAPTAVGQRSLEMTPAPKKFPKKK